MRRGDRGDRGVGGERGPKGDHGQTGDDGHAGERGLVGPRGRGNVVLFVLTVAYVTFTLWQGEHDSCQRQAGVRQATRTFADTAYKARTAAAALDLKKGDRAQYKIDHEAALSYARSKNEARMLDCDRLFPET